MTGWSYRPGRTVTAGMYVRHPDAAAPVRVTRVRRLYTTATLASVLLSVGDDGDLIDVAPGGRIGVWVETS